MVNSEEYRKSNELNQKNYLEDRIFGYIKEFLDISIKSLSIKAIGDIKESTQLYLDEEKFDGSIIKMTSNMLSDGTLRFIAIICILLTHPKYSFIAIEEIDNGIAPEKVKLLLKVLDEISIEREIDILVTTHNAALIDELEEEEMLPFIAIVHRNASNSSKIKYLNDIKRGSKMRSSGKISELIRTPIFLQYIREDD